MSSLGDLLQGKVNDQYPSPPNDIKIKQESHDVKRDKVDRQHGHDQSKHDQSTPQSNDDSQHTGVKLFPERIEKRKIKEDDCRSNASSTDDYVQELLDPNDRPRNVWHVVEGPKESNNDDNGNELNHDNAVPSIKDERAYNRGRSSADRSGATSPYHHKDDYNIENPAKRLKVEPRHDNEAFSHDSPKNYNDERQQPDEAANDMIDSHHDKNHHHKGSPVHKGNKENDVRMPAEGHDPDDGRRMAEDRSSSSRRHHRDRRSSNDDHHRSDHHKDRRRDANDRDKDRRSSRRRHDYSDDEEHGRGSSRHSRSGRGSRSRDYRRSPSGSRSRRRDRSDSHSPSTKRNSRTVLVLQLSQRVTTRDLEKYFSDIGDVREVRLIMDSKTRRHKGIAYIEFEQASSASKALALDGKRFLGVPLQIQSALMERGRGDYQHSKSSSSHHDHHHSSSHLISSSMAPAPRPAHISSRNNLPPNSYRIYMGGLHVGITDEMLKTIVEPFGQILRIELIKDRNTGASRGYAFILYANVADGQEAVRCLDGFELAGKHLRVSKSTEKGEREH